MQTSPECQIRIANWLRTKNLEVLEEVTLPPTLMRADLLIPKLNVVIEVHGAQHEVALFGEKNLLNQQRRDNVKNEYLQSHGLRLIEVKLGTIYPNKELLETLGKKILDALEREYPFQVVHI